MPWKTREPRVPQVARRVKLGGKAYDVHTDGSYHYPHAERHDRRELGLSAPPAPPKPKRAWATAVDVERRRAGICQRCDEPTVGKPRVALYCEAHRKEARAEAHRKMRAKVGDRYTRAYAERNREKLAAKARAYYQGDPAVRERRNAYKRLWRKLNREKVRAQKVRAALKHFRELPEWQRHYREDIRAGKRKPKRARTNKNGERLCVTPYCRSVMHGRAKKCAKCKSAEARAAREALTQSIVRAA